MEWKWPKKNPIDKLTYQHSENTFDMKRWQWRFKMNIIVGIQRASQFFKVAAICDDTAFPWYSSARLSPGDRKKEQKRKQSNKRKKVLKWWEIFRNNNDKWMMKWIKMVKRMKYEIAMALGILFSLFKNWKQWQYPNKKKYREKNANYHLKPEHLLCKSHLVQWNTYNCPYLSFVL